MGFLGLWMVAGVMLLSAVLLGWAMVKANPFVGKLIRRSRERRHRRNLVRVACADLDDEYRELLNHRLS
ncbi:MAG TPA: hypothetical protein VIT20_05135 [Propionibacteriaceae bacterium]